MVATPLRKARIVRAVAVFEFFPSSVCFRISMYFWHKYFRRKRGSRMFFSFSQVLCASENPFHLIRYSLLDPYFLSSMMASAWNIPPSVGVSLSSMGNSAFFFTTGEGGSFSAAVILASFSFLFTSFLALLLASLSLDFSFDVFVGKSFDENLDDVSFGTGFNAFVDESLDEGGGDLVDESLDEGLDALVDGSFDGSLDALFDGSFDGDLDALFDGSFDDDLDALVDGSLDGDLDALFDGSFDDDLDALVDGSLDGDLDALFDGSFDDDLDALVDGSFDDDL